jgi:hypothetical protein
LICLKSSAFGDHTPFESNSSIWIRSSKIVYNVYFRDVTIKEEPNSREKRDRRKDDGKGRRRDKPNNLVQVQLFKRLQRN